MIKEEPIKVKITMYNRDYYRGLGFDLHDGKGQSVTVSSLDVKPTSAIKVTRICDNCGTARELSRDKVRGMCGSCTTAIRNKAGAKPERHICPECGGKKSPKANTCATCCPRHGENNPMFGRKNPSLVERNKNRKPEEHWNWKGGHDSKRDSKTISWSNHVRSGKSCDCCGFSNPMAIDAHHLQGYDIEPELRYEISNGVPLCKNCHTIFHKTYGFGKNTTEQYLEFKEIYNGSN